jgi:CO/xanthine dehydrogenase FAD-binding subunit
MRAAVSTLTLLEPRSLREALRLLRDERPLVPLAGCTDVYVALNFGTLPARRYLNIWGLEALRGIRREQGGLRLGALTTYSELRASKLVARHLPMLAAAAAEIGGPQVQNRGTLGGNVANASPAGDTLPVLAAADARVVLLSLDGARRVPFGSFYTGYRRTVMRPDELIAAFEVPAVPGRQWFRKVGTRAAQAISKVVMAGVRGDGARGEVRLALGSVAPTVVRAPRTEAALGAGAPLEEARRILQEEIAPIDDARSSAEYRRFVAAGLLARFWDETSAPARRA